MTYKKEPIEFLAEILASEDLELPCDDFNDENGEEWDFLKTGLEKQENK